MAQHDYNLANQSGADFRADLNNALAAIATVNSGANEPSTTFAHQLWVDTANSLLKIRNAANTDWITFGVSISSSNVFTGNLTGNVTGNLTGNVTGNVTGDLTGNADTATTLATARTISLSGDVAGSASFDGSGDITITTTAQIDSIALGTDTTGDYVQSISGGTGVTITGGTGESSTPVVAIGQAVAVTSDVTFNTITASNEFIGDLEGGIRFNAKADGALSAGDVVYISGVSGDVPTVAQAKADDASKMPAFGLALSDANDNAALQVVTFGTIENLDTSGVSEGQILYVSTTAGAYTTTAPTGESSQIQNIGKVIRSHAAAGSIKVGGAGRSNATPNLDNGKIFIGNGSNQSATSTLDTSIVPENTNLYWTTARGESMFDTRLATKDTGDLAEGSNLYYTTVRVNSDFDTRLATKSTTNLAEGTNLYYTDARFDTRLATKDTDDLTEGTNLYYTQARFDSAFSNKTTNDLTENTNLYYTDARANSAIDSRVTKTFVDNLGVIAGSVQADSVALGTDTTGNYIQTITGTANKITVTGSGSESADVTLTLPDDVQIADSLTVAGNLTVNGTLTSLDTTNLDIEDNLFQLNAGLTGSPVNDSGMLINRGNQDNGIFMWDESADKFTLGLTTADGTSTGNITLNSLGTLVANIEGNVTGNVTGTVSSLSNHDTADLAEGTNLYYTDARADARVNLQTGANLDLSSKSTSDLAEGTNEYFTTARARSSISATGDISYNSSTGVISFTASAAPVTSVNTLTGAVVLDSDDISEGATNLYYTDARVQAVSINNVVEDTTPQLGGDLDLNSNDITGTGNINITGTIQSSGNITGTLATAAQPNITSLGTLTALTGGTGDLNWDSGTLFVDSSANSVGIGTSTIDNNAKLHIEDSAYPVINLDRSSVTGDGQHIGYINFQNNGDIYGRLAVYAEDVSETDGEIHFQTQKDTLLATKMVITSDGNVGIGTTSPTQKLDVNGTVELNNLTIAGSQGTDGQVLTSTGSGIAWEDASGGVAGIVSSANATAITIDSSENVGIGVTSVNGAKLDVQGGVLVSGALTANQTDAGYLEYGSNILTIGSYGNTTGSGIVRFSTGGGGDGGGQERMRIDSSGKVGIGVIPETWQSTIDALQIGLGGSFAGNTVNPSRVYLSANYYINSSNQESYIATDEASQYFQNAGTHIFNVAPSGTADAAVTWTTAMTIDNSGKVGIGTTSPSKQLTISGDNAEFLLNRTGTYADTINMGSPSGVPTIVGGTHLAFGGSGTWTEHMRIDSSGNVIIGGSSPIGGARFTVDQNSGASIIGADAASASGGYIQLLNNGTAKGLLGFGSNAGASSINNVALRSQSGALEFHTNGSNERMTITSTGSVGINETSPDFSGFGSNGGGLELDDVGQNFTAVKVSHGATGNLYLAANTGAGYLWQYSNSPIIIGTNNAERIRIQDGTGRVGINATGIAYSSSEKLSLYNDNFGFGIKTTSTCAGLWNTGTSGTYIAFAYGSGGAGGGGITFSGASTSYTSASDYRLKENVSYDWDATTRLKQLKPARFNWISDSTNTLQDGFLAHEVSSIVPEAVTGEKDAVYTAEEAENDAGAEAGDIKAQTMDHAKLVPLLVKTIQELEARITALES